MYVDNLHKPIEYQSQDHVVFVHIFVCVILWMFADST